MKISFFILIGIILFGGLFFVFKPKVQDTTVPTNTPSTTQAAKNTEQLNPNTFELTIKEKKLVSGSATIKVNQGENITIKITSDEKEELHIHGYDNSVELEPNKQATLTFLADVSGKFPFELEDSKTEIGALEVQPK